MADNAGSFFFFLERSSRDEKRRRGGELWSDEWKEALGVRAVVERESDDSFC